MTRTSRAVWMRLQAHPFADRALAEIRNVRKSSGLVGQGARYAMAGAVVTVFYMLITTFFALIVGLPFQVALGIGFCCALMMHFTFQRFFVWADREQFALSFHHQAGRYLMASGVQYGLTVACTSLLPPLLGMSPEAVYIAAVPLLALCNFLMLRYAVFHGAKVAPGPPV